MPRRTLPRCSHLSALACLLLLNACGGGGGGSTATQGGSGSGSTSGGGTTFAVSGVVATGAPLPGASIKVIDSSGTAVGLLDSAGNALAAGSTNLTDGSYSLTLNTGSPKVPLLIEASGFDVAGNPVVLHSMVQAASSPAVANVTPATEAVLAQVLGADPKTVFQKAAEYTSAIATLGNTTAVSGASDNLKAVIASNLTDGKVTSAKDLDFFKDASFVANKLGLDATLEGLRIQVAKDASGKDQLQISNKLVNPGTTEVAIDLATARTELTKSSGGTVANAITSTTKKTTSSSTSASHLDVLDELTASVNKLIAQGANTAAFAPAFSATPAPSSAVIVQTGPVQYSYFGRTKAATQTRLANYGTNNYQLSKFQVTGCVEDPISTKGCAYIGVSANVTDATGKLIEVFSDAVIYSKDTTPKWLFAGNGRATEVGVFPAGVATFGADGTPADTQNPNFGIQLAVRAQDENGTQTVTSALVTLPNGHTVNMAYCGQPLLCLTATSTATPVSTGELKDNLLQQPTINWIGTQDTIAGAKYAVTYNITPGNAAHKGNAYLRSGLVTDTPVASFPVPDGIKTTPLTSATLLAGSTLTWDTWAATNPTVKVMSARIIVTGTGGTSPVIKDVLVPPGKKNTITLPAITLAQGFTATGYQLWLVGQDSAGRRLYSKFTIAP